MNFMLSEEQELIRSNAREFALKYIEPVATKIDQESRHPVEVFDKLAELDMMGISYPSEYGGGGAEFLTTMIVTKNWPLLPLTTGFFMDTVTACYRHPILTLAMKNIS